MSNQREWLEGMNDLSFEFNSPMTKEDWDKLQDNEMEDTEEVIFKTPSGKRVTFRKVKHGEWIEEEYSKEDDWGVNNYHFHICSECHERISNEYFSKRWVCCPYCGADMKERKDSK